MTTIWPGAERLLNDAPELEAKALFEHLIVGGAALEAQNALRTFQRRALSWRRHHGPPKEVFFPQAREPGASMQLDLEMAYFAVLCDLTGNLLDIYASDVMMI